MVLGDDLADLAAQDGHGHVAEGGRSQKRNYPLEKGLLVKGDIGVEADEQGKDVMGEDLVSELVRQVAEFGGHFESGTPAFYCYSICVL